MKKFSLSVISLSVLLAACGGGGGGGVESYSTPGVSAYTTQLSQPAPNVVQSTPIVRTGEIYVNSLGGNLGLTFQPDNLPEWITFTNSQYIAAESNCSTRSAELTDKSNKITVIQTSKFRCSDPDYNLTSNWIFSEHPNDYWKEQTGLWFTDPQADWPSKRGGGQFKFEVKYGDCGGTDCTRLDGTRDRSEIGVLFEKTVVNDWARFFPDPNQEIWYSFSFYVPKPYTEQGNQYGTSETLSIHQIMNTGDKDGVRYWFPMVMLAKQYNGPFVARTYPTSSPYIVYKLIDDENFEGHWHDVLVRYKADTVKGILQIWINGQLKVDYNERTLLYSDTSIYNKFGLYRPAVPTNPVQNIYFDELRYGKTRAEVDFR